MEKSEKTTTKSFQGINFESLGGDFGMIFANTDVQEKDAGKEQEQKESGDDSKINNLDLSILTQKIAIPETEEEIKAALKKSGKTDKKSDDKGEVEVIDENQDKGGEDAIEEDSPLYLHAATLHEEGILPTLDLETLKGKPFKEAFQILLAEQKKYIDSGREEYINSLTPRQKEFLEMIELGIPQEQVEHQVSIEDAYSKVTDQVLSDDEELQKQILVQSLKLKGLSDSKVDIFLKASEDKERLFEDAKEARDEINAFIAEQKEEQIAQAKQAQADAEKAELELQKEIKTTIEKTEEIFPGIKISAAEKTKLNDLMTKPVEEKVINGRKVPINLINKKRMEDRVMFDLKLNYFIQLGLFDSKADLSKLVKKVTSTAADKLSKKLSEDVSGVTGKGVSFEKDDSKKKQKIIFPNFNY